MTITAPERSLVQRMQALQLANDIRHRRSELKRQMTRQAALPLLADPPDYLATMKVLDLLRAVPAVGPVKAGKMLRYAEVSPSKTVGGISPRQRQALARALGGRAGEGDGARSGYLRARGGD